MAILSEAANTVNDHSRCELHVAQKVKNLLHEVRADVGKMYAYRNASTAATWHHAAIAGIEWMVHTTVRRVVMRPPESERGNLRLLLDALYTLDGEWHKRGKRPEDPEAGGHLEESAAKTSYLLQDLEELARLQLFSLPQQASTLEDGRQVRVHCCWDDELGGPCCTSEEMTQDRVAVALINFHCGSALDQVTLGKFTNVSKLRKRLIVAMQSDSLFLSAANFACQKSADPHKPCVPQLPGATSTAEFGSGDKDVYEQQRTRCSLLTRWWGEKAFFYRIPVTEVCLDLVERFQVAFFGHDGSVISCFDFLDRFRSPIGLCLQGMWVLLSNFKPGSAEPWRVLWLSGWRDYTLAELRLCARGQLVGLSCSMGEQYDWRCSEEPWSMIRLVGVLWTDAEKETVVNTVLNDR